MRPGGRAAVDDPRGFGRTRPATVRADPATPPTVTALLGRETEIAWLVETIARSGSAVVVGESGVGKSALLGAVAAASGRRAFLGGALGLLRSDPHLALRRAVGPLPAIGAADVARVVVQRVGDGILVLDDLQWAAEATLDVIERIASVAIVLGAVRSTDPAARPIVERLRGAGLTARDLGPLEPTDAAELARRVRPGLGDATARRVAARAGGNPLLVSELARSGESTSLTRAIAHQVRELDDATRRALEILAIAGAPIEWATAPTTIRGLADTGFAVRTGDGLAIRHDLVAETIVDAVARDRPEALPELHREAATLMLEPLAVARHLAAAGDHEAAAAHARASATTASPGMAIALRALAAELARGDDAARWRLASAEELVDAGSFGSARRLLEQVEALDGPDEVRRLRCRSHARWGTGDAPGALEDARAARAAADFGTAHAAEAAVQLAWTLTMLRRAAEATALAADALAEVRALGLPEAAAKRTLATARSIGGAPMREWEHHLLDALADARAAHETSEELLAGKILVASHEGSGDPAEGRRIGETLLARARATGFVAWEQSLRASLLSLANGQADYRRTVTDGETLLAEPLEARTRAQAAGYVALALVDLGRFEEATATIAVARRLAPDDVDGGFDLVWAEAELALAGGDARDADRIATAGLARFDTADYGDLRHLAIARDWARLELGRDLGPPVADEEMHPAWAGTPHESRAIRLLAHADRPLDTAGGAVHGLLSEAAERFAQATQAYARHHVRGAIRCRWAQGEALRRAGRIGEAVGVLEAVEVDAAALGLEPMAGRVRRSLRLAGSRRTARRSAAGRLTAREREVLDLVAGGLTNGQIASRLGIGRPTVSRILANAGAKLGTVSRQQAALEAQELV